MTLGDDELQRYARHIVLQDFGGTAQARLTASHAVVIGCGGIGSPAIQYLAAAGVGRLTLVDDDVVELSNLQRQTLFTAADQGHAKAAVAAERAVAINPHVRVEPVVERIDAANAHTLIREAEVVLDGCDNFATRLAIADAALAARVPLVSAAVVQFEGQLAVYRGWEAALPCYRCLVGADPDREAASCADQGILGPVAGVMGTLAAVEVLRALAPFGTDPAGTLLLVDALAFRFRTIALPKDPGCPVCAA